MTEWEPEDIKAHMDHCGAVQDELTASGDLATSHAPTGPEPAKVVTAGAAGAAPVVTDGPFAGT